MYNLKYNVRMSFFIAHLIFMAVRELNLFYRESIHFRFLPSIHYETHKIAYKIFVTDYNGTF